MIVDARSAPENYTLATDVCIVGAGVAGITLAREFIAQKFQVCLVESGDLKFNADTQSLYSGENVGQPYFELDSARARYFGGTANFWDIDIGEDRIGVRLRELDNIDFEEREWVPYSGWPFEKSHIEPYYKRAQSIFQVEPSTYDVEDWEDAEYTCRLPFIDGRVKTIIYKFGWRDLFTKDYTYEICHRADNILPLVFANVLEIQTDETAQTVTRLRVSCLQGNTFWISAKLYILAAGGIEIPRLMLLSNRTVKVGLGNQNDLVGRFFMEHLHFWSGVYVPSDSNLFASTALYNNIRSVEHVPIIGKLALSDNVLRREKLVNQNIQLIPREISQEIVYPNVKSSGVDSMKRIYSAFQNRKLPENPIELLSKISRDFDDVAITAYRKLRRKLCNIKKKRIKAFILANMTEQVPNPNSRLTLSGERDYLGLNRVKLKWQLSEIDLLSVIRTQQIIDEELRRACLGRVYIQLTDTTPPEDLHGGYHHMGTTRMHADPKRGVVDEHCRVHGMSNLFIAGPSVFPTGGYANPVLTIVALSVRLADHVKEIMMGTSYTLQSDQTAKA